MELLIAKIFSPKQASAAILLSKEEETRTLIVQEVGQQLLSVDTILPHPLDQLLAIASLASFADEIERAEVAGMICRHADDLDVLPAIAVHQGRELGERCLLGLAFFIKQMEHRTRRRAAPSPDFYRQVGQQTFRKAGLVDLSEHFLKWEMFLSERLQ